MVPFGGGRIPGGPGGSGGVGVGAVTVERRAGPRPPPQYGGSDSYRVATTAQDKGEKESPKKGKGKRDLDDLKKEVAMVSMGVFGGGGGTSGFGGGMGAVG